MASSYSGEVLWKVGDTPVSLRLSYGAIARLIDRYGKDEWESNFGLALDRYDVVEISEIAAAMLVDQNFTAEEIFEQSPPLYPLRQALMECYWFSMHGPEWREVREKQSKEDAKGLGPFAQLIRSLQLYKKPSPVE